MMFYEYNNTQSSQRNFRIIPLASALISVSLFLLLSGCVDKEIETISALLIENLADTIYAGENRLVMLTDGTGGYFYDDALKAPTESSFGYSHGEHRLLAEWKVSTLAGEPIDGTPFFAVAEPGWIERHFEGGLIERIDMPHGKSGIYIDLKRSSHDGFIFRPQSDFRLFDLEEKPNYISQWDDELHTLSLARADGVGGWLAIACLKNVTYRELEQKEIREYRISELKGKPGNIDTWSPGEFKVKSSSAIFAIGHGKDRFLAAENARFLLNNREALRDERDEWMTGILRKIKVSCDDLEFIRAFDWARLTLAKLIYTKDDEKFLLTGLPDSPFPDGWFTCLALPGIISSGSDREIVVELLNSILSRQNTNELSPEFGMLPGQIRDDNVEYRIPEIAGLALMAYEDIFPEESDTIYADNFATAIGRSLLGTMKYRLQMGVENSGANQNFLGDSPKAVDRSGATIETQVLLYKIRSFLKSYPRPDNIPFDIPGSLISGAGSLSARSFDTPIVTVGEAGEFNVPLLLESAMSPFRSRKDIYWADRLAFPSEGDSIEHPYPTYNSRASLMLALDWYKSKDHRRANEAYEFAVEQGLIGEAGFRSLSPYDNEYTSSHVYLEENSLTGTKSKGDVLVWTGGVLGNMLTNAEQIDSLWALMEKLKLRVMHQGLTGALAEAENGETVDVLRDVVGSAVHVTSTAEYVRLVTKYLLGVESESGSYMTLRPRFPAHWGKTRLEIEHLGGVVILERDENGIYNVCQRNVVPYLQLALEVFPEPGMRALGSVRLYPDEQAEIEFVPMDNGRWTSKIRKEK